MGPQVTDGEMAPAQDEKASSAAGLHLPGPTPSPIPPSQAPLTLSHKDVCTRGQDPVGEGGLVKAAELRDLDCLGSLTSGVWPGDRCLSFFINIIGIIMVPPL